MRGPPRRATHGPTRLTRRPAGLPTDSSLRSASVVDGACQIKVKSKIKSRARRPSSRPEWLKQKQGNSTAIHLYLMHSVLNVGAGLLAKGVVQSAHLSLTHRLREQARSHKLTEFSRQHCTALLCFSVGAGLPAMQAPRWVRYTGLMPSQASQLPHLIEFSFQDQVGCQAASPSLLI